MGYLLCFCFETQRKLQETERRLQEANDNAKETGKKLQVLMNAVKYGQPGVHPVTPIVATTTSQQTTSTQRQFEWHQSSQGSLENITRCSCNYSDY